MGYIYIGDEGTEIRVNCVSDISTAENPYISVLKPDGSQVNWPCTREGNVLVYLTKAGDLSVQGIYKVQAVPNLPSWKGRGRTAEFTVFNTFNLR